MRVVRLVALAASLVMLASGAAAQDYDGFDRVETPKEKVLAEASVFIRAYFKNHATLVESLRKNLPMYNDEQLGLMAQSLSAVFTSKAVETRFLSWLEPSLDANYSREQMATLFREATASLKIKGLRRLDDEGLAFYLGSVKEVLEFLPAPVCKALLAGELDTKKTNLAEHLWMSKLDAPRFQAMLDFNARMMIAEASERPSVRTLSADQQELAEKAFEAQLVPRIRAMPNPGAAVEVLKSGLKYGDPVTVCEVGKKIVEANLAIAEPVRSWALLKFVTDVAR